LVDGVVDARTLMLVARWIYREQDNLGIGGYRMLPDDDRITRFAIGLEKAASRIESSKRSRRKAK
jgi:hypothetical protein